MVQMPAWAAERDYADVDGFLAAVYGNRLTDDPNNFETTASDGWSVCAEETHKRVTLLAVCETMYGPPGRPGQSRIDFYVLDETAQGTLKLRAKRVNVALSSDFGDPGVVMIREFGPSLYGFEVICFYNAQGAGNKQATIFLPIERKIYRSSFLTVWLDTLDSSICDGADTDKNCAYAQFTLMPDKSNLHATVWPLIVTEDGIEHGMRADRQWRVPFDAGSRTYKIPASLQQVY